MKKLYKVTLEFETVVLAENEQQAEREGNYVIKGGDEEPYCYAEEIKNISDLPGGWDTDCRPWSAALLRGEASWGENEFDKTIGDLLEDKQKL